jgi:hypothetical protein
MDRHQMAGEITSLNSGVARNSKKWQETALHRLQSQGKRDDVYNRHDYLRMARNYVMGRRSNTAL